MNNIANTITFEDFKKLDIKIGKVISAEKVEGADKLLRLEVDFGSAEQNYGDSDILNLETQGQQKRIIRQIVSGIAQFYTPEDLVGKEYPFLINLEPRAFKGVESQGMILATEDNGKPVLLQPDKEVAVGSVVK